MRPSDHVEFNSIPFVRRSVVFFFNDYQPSNPKAFDLYCSKLKSFFDNSESRHTDCATCACVLQSCCTCIDDIQFYLYLGIGGRYLNQWRAIYYFSCFIRVLGILAIIMVNTTRPLYKYSIYTTGRRSFRYRA